MRSFCLMGCIGLSSVAMAVDVDPFVASGSMTHSSGTPSTESPELTNAGLSAGLTATLARDLVRYRYPSGHIDSLVPEAFNTALYGGWTFEDRLRVELIAPIYLSTQSGTTIDSFSGPALGDFLLQGNLRLFENESGSFSASVVPTFGVPTGRRAAYLDRGPHMRLRGAVGGTIQERFGYAANLGFTLSPGALYEDVAVGSTLEGAAGAWVFLDRNLRVGADYEHRIGVSNAPGNRNVIAWTNAFAQIASPEGVGLWVGAGKGLYRGVGSPAWRVQAAVTFARRTRDTDGDGISDRDDACPLDPEDFDNFEDLDGCPDLDNDGDTFLDPFDACPVEPEDFDGFDDLDGCPDPDNDGDGILDDDDACPNLPGIPDLDGCPDADGDGITDAFDQCPLDPGPVELMGCPDRDTDGIADFRDACPDTPRSPDEPLASSNGCPTKAFVQGDRITITERVLFETGKATIRPESFGLLDDVVAALSGTPQILRVEVAGHTDNVGNARFNKGLSQRRARSVMDYLLREGVEPGRLTSAGYGFDDPIDTNLTESGRERNRRVEFRILEQEPITEEVSVRLGLDVGGITVTLPVERRYVSVEVDGELASPRAPFRGLIVAPGTHQVRVVDESMGLDFTETVQVEGGTIEVVRVPEGAIENTYSEPAVGPVPDGSPLAVPPDGVPPTPTDRTPALDDIPLIDDGPPIEDEAPTDGALPGDLPGALPIDQADDAPSAPSERRRFSAPPPVEEPQLRSEPEPQPEAGDPARATPAEPPSAEPEPTPIDSDVDLAPPPAAAPALPGLGEASSERVGGPGFGEPELDPKRAKAAERARKRAEKQEAKRQKAEEKARKKAEKAEERARRRGESPPDPVVDPSTLGPVDDAPPEGDGDGNDDSPWGGDDG